MCMRIEAWGLCSCGDVGLGRDHCYLDRLLVGISGC